MSNNFILSTSQSSKPSLGTLAFWKHSSGRMSIPKITASRVDISQDESKPFLLNLESPSETLSESFEISDIDSPISKEHRMQRSVLYLIALSISVTGLQFSFSIQFAESTQYLMFLGISPNITGLLWLVPPLCGSLVQPCFGAWSDRCNSRFGKRRPFIVGGGIGIMVSCLGFARSKDIAILLNAEPAGSCTSSSCPSQWIAIVFLVGINVAAQPLQNGIRALSVDNCPSEQQAQATAWGGRIGGISSCFLYGFAYVDLPKTFPFLGTTQLKALTIIASWTLFVTLIITCASISERRPDSENIYGGRNQSLVEQATLAFRSLSKYLRSIFAVQFICWFAWFPFMVYATGHVSEFYYVEMLRQNPDTKQAEQLEMRERANRAGALALLGLSAAGFLTSGIVPLLFNHFSTEGKPLHQPVPSSLPWYHRVKFPWLTLRLIWIWAQLFYTVCSFGIILTPFPIGKVIIVSFMGISWGVITWAPMALVNIEILRIGDNPIKHSANRQTDAGTSVGTMLGINNIYIAAPQILGLLTSSVIFFFVRQAGAMNAVIGTSWVLAMCGIASFVAALMLYYIKDR